MPLRFDLGSGAIIHEKSSLISHWVLINDPSLPVEILPETFRGPVAGYGSAVGYVQHVEYDLKISEPMTAIQITLIPFDVWDNRMKSLTLTEVRDFIAGEAKIKGRWTGLEEEDAAYNLNVIAYVDRVRMRDGSILNANYDLVQSEIDKILSSSGR